MIKINDDLVLFCNKIILLRKYIFLINLKYVMRENKNIKIKV